MRTRRERGRPLASTEQSPDQPDNPDTAPALDSDVAALDSTASATLVATTASSPDSPTFAELGVRDEIVTALTAAGIEHTFAIQELTLPLALAGEDVIGQARTGTGKTLGFGVPLLHRVGAPTEDGTPRALVVVPTRELCLQVAADLEAASRHLGTRVVSIYGGRPYEAQIAALQRGVEFVVGTPGRLLDLAQQGHLVLAKIAGLVLDEADEMLDLGFLPDVERILGMLPERRQTMLFSATMPGPIITLARTFLTRPTHIRAEQVDASAIGERTAQFAYRAHALDKVEMLARVLQASERGSTMVFTRTKRTASKVADELGERGFAVGAVHGDLGQGAREHALEGFRSGKIDVLVCTDVAARGIDVSGITHVVNYQCPDDAKTYVHRIGRTGRAGRTGIAVTLVDWDDLPKWKMISDDLELGAPVPPETYSSSPHLFADLGIPADVSDRVASAGRTRRRSGSNRSGAGDGAGAENGSGETSSDDGASPERPRRARSRSRVRRRGGEVVAANDDGSGSGSSDGASAVGTGGTDAASGGPDGGVASNGGSTNGGSTNGASTDGDPTDGADGGDSSQGDRARRRRRRRGGRRSGSGGTDGGDAVSVPDDMAPAARGA